MGVYEKNPGSGIYYALWYDENGKRQREACGTRKYAQTVLEEKRRAVRMARQLPELTAQHKMAKVTFGELVKDALAYSKAHHKAPVTELQRLNRMCEWWDKTPAVSITASEIDRRFQAMKSRAFRGAAVSGTPLSGATLNRYRACLSLIFKIAQENNRVPLGFNPARLVKLRKESARVRYLTPEEETRLRAVVARDYPEKMPLIDVALNTGLRWSDQRELVVENRDGGTMNVVVAKTGVVLGLKANRLANEAMNVLAGQADSAGRLVREQSIKGWFTKALVKAGIPNFHWHDLRHTFATRLLMAGADIREVQKLLGHKSITMTLRYAHLVEGFESDALAKLEVMNRRCASGKVAKVTSIVTKSDGRRSSTVLRKKAVNA